MLLTTNGLGKRYDRGSVAVDALVDVSLSIDEHAFADHGGHAAEAAHAGAGVVFHAVRFQATRLLQ